MRDKGISDAGQGFDRRALEYQIGAGQGNRLGGHGEAANLIRSFWNVNQRGACRDQVLVWPSPIKEPS